MQVHIYCDERYPNFGIALRESFSSLKIEISDEFFAEFEAVEAAYGKMQEKLRELAKQQNGPADTRPSEMP